MILDNSITLKLFDQYGSEPAYTSRLASRARGIRFGSIFPGGYSSLSFFVPCDITLPLEISEGCKILAFNWTAEVWHGFVTSLAYVLSSSGETGISVLAAGGFGYVMGSQRIDKRWADNRIDVNTWRDGPPTGFSDLNPDRFSKLDRSKGRMRIETKNAAYSSGDGLSAYYEMPIGDTVKRVRLSYQLQEGGGDLTLRLYNVQAAANIWSVNASGSGARDDTLGTPSRRIFMQLYASGAHTGTSDGSRFGQIDNAVSGANEIMIYSETGSINAYEVARDLVGLLSALSSVTDGIDSTLNVSVEPFLTEGKEAAASILQRICSYGTASYGPVGFAVWGSQQTLDGKPQLFVAPYPDLSSHEYVIDAGDPALEAPLTIARDVSGVVNYVCVRYLDALGRENIVTPDDDATLRDDTSISLYGRREPDSDLSIGTGSSALAIRAGRAYIANKKDPRPYVSGPIRVYGAIKNADGGKTPVSEIRAGERIRLANVADDVFNQAGVGATFVITEIEYVDDDQSATISCGLPDSLATFLAAMSLVPVKNAQAI
jgi:hypothetical protein